MRRLILAVAILCVPFSAFAQTTATGASKLAWDIAAPSLTEAQAYTWKYYPDALPAVTLAPAAVTCATTATAGTFTCSTPYPAFTPGVTHTIKITATNAAGEAPQSAPLSFTFQVIPNQATNVRAQ